MRKTIYTTLLLFFALSVSAGQRTREQAQAIAQKLAERIGTTVDSELASSAKAKHKAASTAAETDAYYVFDNGNDNGYIIVSGEDKLPAIIGYTDKGSFDADNLPVQLKEFLESYTELVGSVEDGTITLDDAVTTDNTGSNGSTITTVAPLLGQIMWNQGDPYNLQCPEIEGEHAVTGCGPTAVAQVMKYWKYPSALTKTIPSYTQGTTTYDAIELSETAEDNAYDWDNMLPQYSSSATDNQKAAVAKLMNHVGHVMQATYGLSATGGTSTSYEALKSAFSFYGYNSTLLQSLRKYNFSYTEWKTMINNEIRHSRPIVYAGQAGPYGHAFVLDGIDESGLYHVNWGWAGSCNGYFDVTILNPYDNTGIGASTSTDGYNGYAMMVVGITSVQETSETPYTTPGTKPETSVDNLTFSLTDKDGGSTLLHNSSYEVYNKLKLSVTNNNNNEFDGCIYVSMDGGDKTPMYIYVPTNSTSEFNINVDIPTTETAGHTYTVTLYKSDGTTQFASTKFTIADVGLPVLTATLTSNASSTITNGKYTLFDNKVTYTLSVTNTGGYYRGNDFFAGHRNYGNTNFSGNYSVVEFPANSTTTLTYSKDNLVIDDYTGFLFQSSNDKINFEKVCFVWVAGQKVDVAIADANKANNDNAYYSSLYLDYAVQMPDGVSAYTATIDKANSTVTLNKIEDGMVPAKTAVVLRMLNTGSYEFTPCSTSKTVTNDLQGVLTDTNVSTISSTPYVLSIYNGSPAFQKYSGSTLKANKAYLILPSSAKSFKFNFADDEVDGISEVKSEESRVKNSSYSYNLNGQRVNKGTKGIVIANGKKYLNN